MTYSSQAPTSLPTWRAHLIVITAYLVLAIAMTYPLALHPLNAIPAGADAFKHTWRMAWIAHQLLADPLHLFNANSFYAYLNSFAYDDIMLTQGLSVMPITLATGNPALAQNLVILSTFVFAAYAMFLLGYHLTRHRAAAWIAGLVFAFSTFRFAHFSHLNLLGVEWLPLFFLALDQTLRAARPRVIALAAVTGVLQILSSFMVAYFFFLAVVVYLALYLSWHRRTLSWKIFGRLMLVGTLIGCAVLPFALPYYHAANELKFERDEATVEALSATLNSYLAVPSTNWLYGKLLARFGHYGNFPSEHILFPGFLAPVLAGLGTVAMWRRAPVKIFFAIALVMFILSFGPRLYISADQIIPLRFALPYQWLYDYLPGFASLRAGARFDALVMFGIAALAAFGAAWLLGHGSARGARVLGLALLSGIAILENIAVPFTVQDAPVGARVPGVYRWLASYDPSAPIAELPIPNPNTVALQLSKYQYFSAYHWHPILTAAYFSYWPADYKFILGTLGEFPSDATFDLMHEFEARYIVVHSGDMDAHTWNELQTKLNAQRLEPLKQFGSDYVYEIKSGAEAFGDLRAQIFVPPQVKANQPVPLYLLLTNPTPRLFFFKPSRRINANVNGTPVSFSMPLLLESGTAVIATTLATQSTTLNISSAAGSIIPFPATNAQIAFTSETINPRPISLQMTHHQNEARGGNAYHLTLQWRVLARVRELYQLELSVLNHAGHEIAQAMTNHAADPNPSVHWRPGQILTDELDFTIPPESAANGHVVIQLFDPETGQPLYSLDEHATPLPQVDLGALPSR